MLDVISPSDPPPLKSQLPAYIRARGILSARLQDSGRGTRVFDLSEAGGYRLKFPHADPCEAMIVNTGGGMAGGDHLALSLSLGPQAVAVCSTQSAEKIYRAERDRAEITVTLTLDDAANLAWLPQETILFDGAQLHRKLTLDMAANATFMACESVSTGSDFVPSDHTTWYFVGAAFRRAFDAYPSGEGRLALSGEDLDRYRKSGSMAVSTC
jgi:urease accessory protein